MSLWLAILRLFGVDEFVETELVAFYGDFLTEQLGEDWQSKWLGGTVESITYPGYTGTIDTFSNVQTLLEGSSPFDSGTWNAYLPEYYPERYASIEFDDTAEDGLGFNFRYFDEGAHVPALSFELRDRNTRFIIEARAFYRIKDVEYEALNPDDPFSAPDLSKAKIPALIIVEEVWYGRNFFGEKRGVEYEYLHIYEGDFLTYGAPFISGTNGWPAFSGVPADTFEGQFHIFSLARFANDEVFEIAPQVKGSGEIYWVRDSRDYGDGSLVADVEPNDAWSSAPFIPIGYSTEVVGETHMLGTADDEDRFKFKAIAGCGDTHPDPDPECANEIVLPLKIVAVTEAVNARLDLELFMEKPGGWVSLYKNEVILSDGAQKFITLSADELSRNGQTIGSPETIEIGQTLGVSVSLNEITPDGIDVDYELQLLPQ